jgi:hypothetical protein
MLCLCNTVVEHSTHSLKIDGSNPTTCTKREKGKTVKSILKHKIIMTTNTIFLWAHDHYFGTTYGKLIQNCKGRGQNGFYIGKSFFIFTDSSIWHFHLWQNCPLVLATWGLQYVYNLSHFVLQGSQGKYNTLLLLRARIDAK